MTHPDAHFTRKVAALVAENDARVPVQRHDGGVTESLYTFHEAQRELRRRQCAATGHEWSIQSDMGGQPRHITCDSCGWSGSVGMGDRPKTHETAPTPKGEGGQ